jgi:hypothetical protein
MPDVIRNFFVYPECEQKRRQVKRMPVVTQRDAHVFHAGVLQASRQLLDPEVELGVGLLTRLARMAEA